MLTKPPAVSAPDSLRPDLADLTLRDEGVEDVTLRLVQEVLTVGRAGVLVDMPESGSGRPRPYWALFEAEDVVNWRTDRVGNDPSQLVQVVIREYGPVADDDPFSHKVEERYRELALALVDGVYRVRTWVRSDPKLVVNTEATPWRPNEWITPTRRGEPLRFIPFCFVSPVGIATDVARPPLEDLAEVIVGHYRNSADLEWGLFHTALPTPWISGAGTSDQQTLRLGSSVAWKLGENARAGMLEFRGDGLKAIADAMSAKEKQMAVLGARLLLEEPSARVAETATSAMLRHGAEAASLRTVASAVSAALTRCLRWHAWWVGTERDLPLDVRADLSRDFLNVKASPDEVRALLMLAQAGKVSYETFFHLLAQGGWARPGVSAEAELQAIRSEEPPLDDSGPADGGPGGRD